MLQDRECQFIKLINQTYCGINVQQVVVRDLLSVDLLEHLVELTIELTCLVRILAIAQVHGAIYRRTEV